MLKINCKGKRTVGKANKRINVKKKKGLKILKGEKGEKKRGKCHRTAKPNVEAEVYDNKKCD